MIRKYRTALAKAVKDIEADPHDMAKTEMPKHTDMGAKTTASMHLADYLTKRDGAAAEDVVDPVVMEKLLTKGFQADSLYEEL